MQRFLFSSSSPFLLLSVLFLSSFHGQLLSAQKVFDFPSGQMDNKSLAFLQHASLDSSGSLTLDASTGDAQAFYSQPISLLDSAGLSVLSFTSFFTYVSNGTYGNGTIVFAFTPNVTGAVSLTEARKTLTVEFNTSCSIGTQLMYDIGRGRYGYSGGLGGFQVSEYANSTSISANKTGGYGPGWTNQRAQGPYFCSQQGPQNLLNPTFQYQVAVEYNASTDTLSLGSPSCGAAIARTTQFNVQNLSGIITEPVYVGFLVSGGGIFNISQWNFTSNSNTSSVANLALSSAASTTPGSDSSNGGTGNSNGGVKKGYGIAFSVLGAAIGVAAVL